MKDYFQTLSRYNQWANQRIYDVCQELSAEEYLKDRNAFFLSIHGTLNHLLVADKLWLGRFYSRSSGITALDHILHSDLNSLWIARQQEDAQIAIFIDQTLSERLSEPLTFTTLAGKEMNMPLMWLLSHLFNHQAHHRGQVHNMLSQAGLASPPLDLYYFLMDPVTA